MASIIEGKCIATFLEDITHEKTPGVSVVRFGTYPRMRGRHHGHVCVLVDTKDYLWTVAQLVMKTTKMDTKSRMNQLKNAAKL